MPLPELRYYMGFGANWNAEPSWTEITDKVRTNPGFTLRRGTSALIDRPRPAECGFNVNNDDRDFDPTYAAGPYYGQILPMVQVKVTAEPEPGAAQYVDLDGTGDWADSDYTTAMTGARDIRFKVKADSWTGATLNVCAQGTGAAALNHVAGIDSSGRMFLKLSQDGSTFMTNHSTEAVTNYLDSNGWFCGRVTYSGVLDGTIIWYYSTDSGTTWTEFGTRATYAPGVPLFNSTDPYQVGVRGAAFPFAGKIAWATWRASIGGSIVCGPYFHTSQWDVGDTVNDDAFGNTWTLAGDALIVNDTVPVFRGYVLEWPQQTIGFKHQEARIRCADALTLLARRTIHTVWEDEVAADTPRGWWRFSDPVGSTVLADSSGNGYDGTVTGVTFGGAGPVAGGDEAGAFDGTDDWVELPDRAAMTVGPLSVEAVYRINEAVPVGQPDRIYIQGRLTPGSTAFDFTAGLTVLYITDSNLYMWITPPSGTQVLFELGSAPTVGVWHHVLFTLDGSNNGILYHDGTSVDTGTVTFGTHTGQTVGIGRIAGGAQYYKGDLSEVVTYNTALSSARAAAHYNAAMNAWNGDDTGERIGNILTLVDWPAGWRDLDTGVTTLVPYDTADQTALDAIYDAAQSENGKVYVNPSGQVVFDNRYARSRAAVDYTFGTTIGIRNLNWTIDDQLVASIAGVTGTGGRIQATNTTTLAQIGEVAIERVTQTDSDTEATDYANWLVAQWAPRVRFSALEVGFGVSASDAAWAAILNCGVGDLVRVYWNHPNGTTDIDTRCFVETQTLTVRDNFWQAVYDLSPADGQRIFTLGNATLGVLGTGGLVGW